MPNAPERDTLNREEMAANLLRPCHTCGVEKPLDAFYPRSKKKCKVCRGVEDRARYWSNPNRTTRPAKTYEQMDRAFRRRMGISLAERDEMLEAQGNRCAICGSSEPYGRGWCTDHDHRCCDSKARSCGKCIRGILCYRCNTLLGHAKDSEEILASAISYLTSWEARRAGA